MGKKTKQEKQSQDGWKSQTKDEDDLLTQDAEKPAQVSNEVKEEFKEKSPKEREDHKNSSKERKDNQANHLNNLPTNKHIRLKKGKKTPPKLTTIEDYKKELEFLRKAVSYHKQRRRKLMRAIGSALGNVEDVLDSWENSSIESKNQSEYSAYDEYDGYSGSDPSEDCSNRRCERKQEDGKKGKCNEKTKERRREDKRK
jgi:hypothetical protein